MIKNRFLLCLISISIIIISCSKQNNSKQEEIINLENALSNNLSVKLSEITKDISYVALETNKDCLIKEIVQLNILDSILLINNNYENLFLFTKNGKFISEVGKKGGGPGDFIKIDDFTIDRKSRIITILDSYSKKILKYSINGEYIDDEILVNSFNQIEYFQSSLAFINLLVFRDIIVYLKTENHNDITYSSNDLDLPGSKKDKNFLSFVYTINDTLSYWNYLNNKVVRIDAKGIFNRYYFTFGNNDTPTNKIGEYDLMYLGTNYGIVDRFIETKNLFFIQAAYKKHIKRFIYKKNDHKAYSVKNDYYSSVGDQLSIINDIDCTGSFWPDTKGYINSNLIYKTFFAYDLKEKNVLVDDSLLKNTPVDLQEIIRNSNIQDNPVVMLVNLK